METIQNAKSLNQKIDTFAKNGRKRAEQAHLLAVSALEQAHNHGNLDSLTKLYHAFGATENPAEFRYWVGIHTGNRVTFSQKEGTFKQKAKGEPVQGNVDLEAAKAEPWWDMQKVKDNRNSQAFNPEQDAKKVKSNLERHAKSAEEAGDDALAQIYRRMASDLGTVVERRTMEQEHKNASVREN